MMIIPCNSEGIKIASETIRKGGTVVFPTDTVYGLGCDPHNSGAVRKIYAIKGRERSKHLPVLGYSRTDISRIAILDQLSNRLANKFWPGPLTLILKIKDNQIAGSLGLNDKIAVRVPNHPCALALLRECRLLVGTSANHSGTPPFIDSKEVKKGLKDYDILLDGGRIDKSMESTIVEVKEGELSIIRQGKITEKELHSVI